MLRQIVTNAGDSLVRDLTLIVLYYPHSYTNPGLDAGNVNVFLCRSLFTTNFSGEKVAEDGTASNSPNGSAISFFHN